MLQRQCTCGNHTVAGGECAGCAKNKNGLQRKLAIGSSNDPLEHEADRIANQVLAAPARSAVSGAPLHIQRFSGQSNEQMDAAPASVDQALASPGRPLAPVLRQDMEQHFGHDFSQVRVHSGGVAEQSARDVNAHAYAVGRDMVFSPGRFAPGTHEGRRLIAHELTHVVQQEHAGTLSPVLHRKPAAEPRASEAKPQIVAIEAVMDGKHGTATLSDGKTVPLTLTKNDFPPGTRVLNHLGNGKYASTMPIDPNLKPPGGFL